jgi:uncharacterized membrane protein
MPTILERRRGRTANDEIDEEVIDQRAGGPPPNVSDGERFFAGLGGTALLLYGLRRRSWEGKALALLGGGLLYHGLSGQSPLYRALGFHTVRSTHGRQLLEVVKVMTVDRPVEEAYRYWRHFENLPRFMRHVKSVEIIDDKHSMWTASAPGGTSVTWKAEIVNEKPNELIAWQTVEDSAIRHWGIVRFTPAPGDRGTEVKVELEYEPVAGTLGAAIAQLFGEEPAQQVEEDLRRFKRIMEAGEIPTTEGQPAGGTYLRNKQRAG